MLTVKYLINKKYSLGHTLTKEDKDALIEENRYAEYSYICLMNEMFAYDYITVEDLLTGWGGVKLVQVN